MIKLLAAAILGLTVSASAATTTPIKSEWRESGDKLKSMEGKPAPKLVDLKDWVNTPGFSLDKLKGKIVVLDFWATWCGPCIRGIPHINKLAEKYKGKVVFLGVCHPKGGSKMKALAKKKGIKYPIALDHTGKTIDAYKVGGYPDYYIIGKDGKMLLADCANRSLDEVLKALVK